MGKDKPKKKMGRPKFKDGKALSVRTQVRLTPEEAEILRKAALKDGETLSSWARKHLTRIAKRAIKE